MSEPINPEFWISTYSEVDVYECVVNDTPLMRRCNDNYVNATQILKVANIPKAQRTRILEKEVQTGVHEKVQGGYGRFQGTWIPLDIGRSLAERYKISAELAPILHFTPDPNNPVSRKIRPAKSSLSRSASSVTNTANTDGSPAKKPRKTYNTKKRREAAAAAAVANNEMIQQVPVSNNQPYWQQQQQSMVPQMYPIQQGQPQAKLPYQQQFTSRPPPFPQTQQPGLLNPQFQSYPPPAPSQAPQYPQYGQQQQQYTKSYQPQHQLKPPPQPQFNPQQQQQLQPQFQYKQRHHKDPHSQGEEGGSQHTEHETMKDSDTSISSPQSPRPSYGKLTADAYINELVKYFSQSSTAIPATLLNPPLEFDFNEPFDEDGHTPLHWATSMAKVEFIKVLLKHGSDPMIGNHKGLNCISGCILFNNSYKEGNFPEILDLMKNCIFTPDTNGRTPLHYICEGELEKKEINVYYLGCILQVIKSLNKANVLKIVVNHKDNNQDTALDLAERKGNLDLAEMLRSLDPGEVSKNKITVKEETIDDKTDDDETKEENTEDATEVPSLPSLPSLPVSETGPMLLSMLSFLADAYDVELKDKENESEHAEDALKKIQEDIQTTHSQNMNLLEQIGNGATLEELEQNITRLEEECLSRSSHLTNLLERNQARTLADLVLNEESKISSITPTEAQNHMSLALQLTSLQEERKKSIEEITELMMNSGLNERMNKYRKLISLSCKVKVEDIDDLLNGLEEDLSGAL